MTNAQLAAFRHIASLMQDGRDSFTSAQAEQEPPLKPGDLAVAQDYKGREIGCRVQRVVDGNVFVTVCGLTDPLPYRIGDQLVLDVDKVKKAI